MAGAYRPTRIAATTMLFGLVLAVAILSTTSTARADSGRSPQRAPDCVVAWTNLKNQWDVARAQCYVPKNMQARLRADCPVWPDRYSSWKAGKGYGSGSKLYFKTPSCPSIRKAIMEFRYT